MPIEHLPPVTRPWAERLRDWLLTDAGLMLILGVMMIVRGVAYSNLGQEGLYHPADVFMPRWVAAGVWLGVGSSLLVSSVRQSSLLARVSLSAAVATLALWGMIFMLAPPAAFSQRGIVYLSFAMLVLWASWRGRRGEIRIREELPSGGRRLD